MEGSGISPTRASPRGGGIVRNIAAYTGLLAPTLVGCYL
jgi:hypothetical protein